MKQPSEVRRQSFGWWSLDAGQGFPKLSQGMISDMVKDLTAILQVKTFEFFEMFEIGTFWNQIVFGVFHKLVFDGILVTVPHVPLSPGFPVKG